MFDKFIVEFDKALRTLYVAAADRRVVPGSELVDADLAEEGVRQRARGPRR